MATIANQIQRILESRETLRRKGLALGLTVPANTRYWDKDQKTYAVTDSSAAISNSDQLDKITAAFNSIAVSKAEVIEIPLLIKTDGTTHLGESKTLPEGFYSGAIIKPYITVENDKDFVLNIENISNFVISDSPSGDIYPNKGAGFNYIGSVHYQVQDGALNENAASITNTSVIAKITTSGWLEAGDYTIKVASSKMYQQVGSEAATEITTLNTNISPDATNNTIITIGKGIYSLDRTFTIAPALSQSSGTTATEESILDGYTAWSNGFLLTGKMPNRGGAVDSINYVGYNTDKNLINNNGVLAIPTLEGYYNEYSAINTNILWLNKDSITFNTTVIDTPTITNTLSSSVWFETIPAGYYASAITRKIQVQEAVGAVSINYTNDEAVFSTTKAGWVKLGEVSKATINAGSATYVQTESDLQRTDHAFTIKPSSEGYLKEVTIKNDLIYLMLSEI